tara:strand:- start:69 stop:287 length:219 start_codon:yes stop_codon:yes gene_type:complete
LETDLVFTAPSLQVATFVVLRGPMPEFLRVIGITGAKEFRHSLLELFEALLSLPDLLSDVLGIVKGDVPQIN